jgi:hypothetical protein
MSNVMSKHNRSFFSDSSGDESVPSPQRAKEKTTPKSKSADIDLSCVQEFESIEEGERCLHVLVEFISVSQYRVGPNRVSVNALVSGQWRSYNHLQQHQK